MSSRSSSQTLDHPPLVNWFKSHFENLYIPQQTESHSPLAEVFDATFSPYATLVVNGEIVSRENFLDDIRALRSANGANGGDGDGHHVTPQDTSVSTPTNPMHVKMAKLPFLQRPGTSTMLEWVSVDVTPKRLDGEEEAHASERAGGLGYFVKPEPETGTLSASLTFTRTLPFRVRAGPMQRRRVVSLVARVEHVPELNSSKNGDGNGDDGRRIVRYEETSEEGPVSVRLAPVNLIL